MRGQGSNSGRAQTWAHRQHWHARLQTAQLPRSAHRQLLLVPLTIALISLVVSRPAHNASCLILQTRLPASLPSPACFPPIASLPSSHERGENGARGKEEKPIIDTKAAQNPASR
eukprot:4395459-Pleurochrysis_carterae.AAC.2